MPWKTPNQSGSIRRAQILEEESFGSGGQSVSYESRMAGDSPARLVQPVATSRSGYGTTAALKAEKRIMRRRAEWPNAFSCEINETITLVHGVYTPLKFAICHFYGQNIYQEDFRTTFRPDRTHEGIYANNVSIILDQATVAGALLAYDLAIFRNGQIYKWLARYTQQDAGVTQLDDAWLGNGCRVPVTAVQELDIRIKVHSNVDRTYTFPQSLYGWWDGSRVTCRIDERSNPATPYSITI
jgi:hypothetical protein